MKYFEVALRVRFYETDEMGIVHHSNYLRWLEMSRFDLLKASGIDYQEIKKNNYGFLVTKINCEYVLPAKFGDEIIIQLYVELLRKTMFRFFYYVRRKRDHELLLKGESEHVIIANGRLVFSIPENISKKLLGFMKKYGWIK